MKIHKLGNILIVSAEFDEQWSFVQKKRNQRWLWYAIDKKTKRVIAYVFGKRKDKSLKQLLKLVSFTNIINYYTDDWGSYQRCLPTEANHMIGKDNTQNIERKNLDLRTRLKRLARRTICFSKSEQMHDAVIGLFINMFMF